MMHHYRFNFNGYTNDKKRSLWKRRTPLLGALLCIGNRTVCAGLRFMGLKEERRFHKYHRVLGRVKWSTLIAMRIPLQLLLKSFVRQQEPLVFGIDETIEADVATRLKPRAFSK